MDLDDMICETVRMSFEVDDIEDHSSSIEEIQQILFDIQDKFDPQNVIDLESSIKNLVQHTNQLQLRIAGLEKQANKSFIQKLMFWR